MSEQGRWAYEIARAAQLLSNACVASPEYDARELALAAAGVNSFSVLISECPMRRQVEIFWQFVRRRAAREPLQHITGRMYFRYLELEAQPGVFIVRPETEMVAQAGIDFLAEHYNAANNAAGKEPIITVELFSGSGAIALSIATELRKNIENLAVYGIEMSREAYESSQRNNATYGNMVDFIHADALAPLPKHLAAQIEGNAALVIANPPYVPPYHKLSPEVCADPALALFGGGENGLDIPLATIKCSTELLAPGGALVMEHASEQAAVLRAAATRAGFAGARTGKDLAGADRWLFARWPARPA